MKLRLGMKLTEKKIDALAHHHVLVEGYQNWGFSQYHCEHFSGDSDEDGSFWEAMQYAEKVHHAIWERDHEYEDIISHVTKWTMARLAENGYWQRWKGADPLTCEYGELFTPLKVTETNYKGIARCLRDTAYDVTWALSESKQLFFQTTNPCCWDGKSPQERYGSDWIADTQTRLICMVRDVNADVLERVHEKGHTLTSDRKGYITEYDTEGNEVW